GDSVYLGNSHVNSSVILQGSAIFSKGGTVSSGQLISQAAAPTLDEHLTNKAYVDQKVSNVTSIVDLGTINTATVNINASLGNNFKFVTGSTNITSFNFTNPTD